MIKNKNKIIKISIVGNPNVGKTSLFNKLTGLNQKIGNYAGVTVDKKIGYFSYKENNYHLIDLPGIYSLYPSSDDEEIVTKILLNKKHIDYPNKIIFIANYSYIKKSLLLFRQIQDLGFSTIFVLNMLDEAKKIGITININKLQKLLMTNVVVVNIRKGIGINDLKKLLNNSKKIKNNLFFFPDKNVITAIKKVNSIYKLDNIYHSWYYLASNKNFFLKKNSNDYLILSKIKTKHNIVSKMLQIKEILYRNKETIKIISNVINQKKILEKNKKSISRIIDNRLIIHPIFGYLIFIFILFFIFQCIFSWAEIPKRYIELFFSFFQKKLSEYHSGPITNFLSQGIFPGVITIITFIPQIFILLFFLSLMEESGYISRVIFLMDKIVRPFGLNGKSIIPIISSMACSVPAIISSRHIENYRERLITILSIPFITCSARLPIYTLIISLIIPDKKWHFIKLRGIVLAAMYFIGIIFALMIAMIFHKILKKNYHSNLIIEIPTYKIPVLKDILTNLYIHLKSFIINVGKMVLVINVIIWVLGTFGPSNQKKFSIEEKKLNDSYLGLLGKKIEPIIQPLGYDWKIGIGILSSIITREVFVSTMNSIYKIEKKENLKTTKKNFNPNKKEPIYNISTGISLLFFYALSMQCTSTFSIIRKETSWKWAIIQFFIMTFLAYTISFFIYQTLNFYKK